MEKKTRGFEKVLGTGDVLMTAFGAMIGWGWVVSTGDWIQTAGALGTAIGFLIGGIMIYFVGLVYAELTTAMPECGGPTVFTARAFGRIPSFICTWAIILSYIGVVCFEACSLPTILQYIFPGFLQGYLYTVAGFDIYATWLITAILFAIIITLINVVGVKVAAAFQNVLTVMIGVVGIMLIVASAIRGDLSNLDGQLLVGNSAGSLISNIMSVAVVAPFFLFGFDVIPQAAEEINVPLKRLGRLLVGSIVLAVAFYGLVVMAVGYGMNSNEIAASNSGSGLVTADAMAKVFNSSVMARVLILGGVCGVVTSWNSFLMGGSRALLSLAEARMIPHMFAKIHPRYKTPVNAIILIGVLSIVSVFFGRSMLTWISNSASFACCVSYCIVSVAFLALRKKEPMMDRPFKVKHYRFVGVMAVSMSGLLCIMYLLPGSTSALSSQELFITVGWAVLGVLFAGFCKNRYKDKFGK